jgi:hypothetical protein
VGWFVAWVEQVAARVWADLASERLPPMRFMMLMIPNIPDDNWQPDAKAMAAMIKYNEALQRAGALLALDGLHALSKGARVTFSGGKCRVTDEPASDGRDVVGGYWMIQVRSKAEALEWARRCPASEGNVIELRQVFELSDFSPEVQRAALGGDAAG